MLNVTECDKCGIRLELSEMGEILFATCPDCGCRIAFSSKTGKNVPYPAGGRTE